MPDTRKEVRGGAARLKVQDAMTPASATCNSVGNTAGWPTGATYPFVILVNPGKDNAEKILCSALTGNTFTVVQRGYDGTTPQNHSPDEPIVHGLDADSVETFFRHVFDTTLDQHGQYVPIDGSRGFSNLGTLRGNPIAISTALLPGTSNALAAADHVHVVGAGAINNANMFAAGVVNNAALGAGSVDVAQIAAAVAGNGLEGAAGQPLSVNVDDVTIEINADNVRVKPDGIGPTELNDAGNFTVASLTTTGTVRISATTDVSLSSTGHGFQIGPTAGANLRLDVNEIMAVNNGATATLAVNGDGGNVILGQVGGDHVTFSARDIRAATDGFDTTGQLTLTATRIVHIVGGNSDPLVVEADKVGIGQTAPQNRLHVGGNCRVDGSILINDSDTFWNNESSVINLYINGTKQYALGATSMSVPMAAGSGNAVNWNNVTGTLGFTVSSRRFKDHVHPLLSVVDAPDRDVERLLHDVTVFRYRYKANAVLGDNGREHVGLMAEDLLTELPDYVHTDADGAPVSIGFAEMVPLLVAALQYLDERVTSLERDAA